MKFSLLKMSRLLSPFTNYAIIFLEGLNGICLCIWTERTKYFSVQNFQVYYDLLKNKIKNEWKSKNVIFRILEDLGCIFGTD